jgi:hypothetical protein
MYRRDLGAMTGGAELVIGFFEFGVVAGKAKEGVPGA